MNCTEQQFFALLRSGLWDSQIEESLFTDDTDWSGILKMAAKQTVSGIIFDGISNLPENLQPPTAIMRRLYQTVIRIEQSHELLNDRLTKIIPLLQSESIYPILLKGQGVAQNYPNPVRRQCGDIDLYIGKQDFQRSCELAKEWGIVADEAIEKHRHYHFNWDGVSIELHRIVEELPDPYRNRKFQHWVEYHLQKDKLKTWDLQNRSISLPSVNFNAIYIFIHAFHHFISEGVGFRQLCDWIIHLHKFHDQIDRSELMKDLKDFGLFRVWQIFGCIAVHELGLAKEKFPFYTDEFRKKSQDIILEDILLLGNFGHYNPKWATRPSAYVPGKLYNLKRRSLRALNLYPILRGYMGIYYLHFLAMGIRQIAKDKFK